MMTTTTQSAVQTNNDSAVAPWSQCSRRRDEDGNRCLLLSGKFASQCVESGCKIAALVAAARSTNPTRHP